jgi:hypothetical protein
VRKVTIDVTAKDIKRGVPGSYWACPLGIAMSRAFGSDVLVSTHCFSVLPAKYQPLPNIAFAFRQDFDFGRPVHPFTFEAETSETP